MQRYVQMGILPERLDQRIAYMYNISMINYRTKLQKEVYNEKPELSI